MTYKPAGDERLVVSERPAPSKERIWVTELTRYLGVSATIVKRFAKRSGFLRHVSLGSGKGTCAYVSVYGAQRVIAYVRALQGEEYLNGRDYHGLRQKWREVRARAVARKGALNARTVKPLAFPMAGTEDEDRGVCAADRIGIAETAVVSDRGGGSNRAQSE